MTYGERLQKAMAFAQEQGALSSDPRAWKREVVDAVRHRFGGDITVQAIGAVLRNDYAFKTEKNSWIAAVLGVRSDWLASEAGQMSLPEFPDSELPPTSTQTKPGLNERLPDSSLSAVHASSDTKLIRAPVVEWARLETDLYKGNWEFTAAEALPYTTTKETGSRCKFVTVLKDNLAPKVLPGDKILVDPDNAQPKRDQVALFKIGNDGYELLRYRPIANGFEAYDETSKAPLDSEKHQLKVVATYVVLVREDV